MGMMGLSNIERHTIGLGLSYQPYKWAENDGRQGINKCSYDRKWA